MLFRERKIKLFGLLVFLFVINLNAQTFYYYKGQKINLTIDKNYVNVILDGEFTTFSHSKQFFQQFNMELDSSAITQGIAKLKLKSASTTQDYSTTVNSLRENASIKQVLPFFARGNDVAPIGTSDIFYVKLKDVRDSVLLRNTAEKQNVQVMKGMQYMPQWYILSMKNSTLGNSVNAANFFYETGLFADVDPAFMFNFKANGIPNDPDFNQLWGLKNDGNPGVDINVVDAWGITRGAGVKVAVVDQPIDSTHNDLAANVLLKFDSQYGSSYYNPLYLDHGTHVAGTVAAVGNNNLQVVGVAYESKLMGISHDLYYSPTIGAELGNGISWAWQNGADIITNSWGDKGGGQYNGMYSLILEDAIIDAMALGRGGKGSVVVFAAGNRGGGGPIMDYPGAFHDDILTVGAIASDGNRSSFSGYGSKLDVVAPGSSIWSTVPNNGVASWDGTSMAAPHVAGVAALVLSVDSTLTGQQVRNIIESTSQKVGSYTYSSTVGRLNGTWNNEMGYGLVDAYAAVQMASPTIPPETGDTVKYSFSGASTTITDSLMVTPAGITVQIQNSDYTHGAMISVRNMGLNDSIVVGWYGGTDQNGSTCTYHSEDLFGNGAQINNFVSPKLGDGSVFISIHSATNETYTAEIKIYDWVNGQGCQSGGRQASLEKSRNTDGQKPMAAPAPSNEDNTWVSGQTTVTYDADSKTLTVSGAGAMADYGASAVGTNDAPWVAHLNSGIEKIVIEKGVTRVGNSAFVSILRLESVTCLAEVPPTVGSQGFLGTTLISLIVPQDNIEAYLTAPVWEDFNYINPSVVTFDPQNGGEATTQKVSYGGKAEKPADPVRDNYTFDGWYKDDENGAGKWNFDTDVVTTKTVLSAKWTPAHTASTLNSDRTPPVSSAKGETAAVVTPSVSLSGELTFGPNPVTYSAGVGTFFWRGGRVKNGSLAVYDASGHFIKKIGINDMEVSSQSRREVGSWDLTDRKGRLVSGGTYLVKGMLTIVDGKKEKVSILVNVVK